MPQCSPEDYLLSLNKSAPITCLDTGDSIGITITVESGLLSLLSILFVLGIIGRNVWRRRLHNASMQVFHQPTDILMASLFLADIVQAIGAILSLKWLQTGKVETGAFCNAQGIVKIFGATGVALSTIAIAAYTLLGVWLNVEASMPFTSFLVAGLWSFIGVLVTVAMTVNRHREISFIGPTPFWCWVDAGLGWKVLLEYLWLWLALFFSILVYVPLYLWMRGNLCIPNEAAWWKFRFTRDLNPEFEARRRKAQVMLIYPIIYCVCILPLSAVRWKSFVGDSVAPAATFFGVSVFGLSGFFNAFLLVKTRRSSGLFDHLMFLHPARPPVDEPHDDIHQYEHPHDAEPADMALGRLPPGRPGR